jgi:molybdopterin converting factor small subunit
MFAAARDAVGSSVDVEVPDGATVADLRSQLITDYPQLAELIRRAMFAVDASYASEQSTICGASDVACIPPVSGG